MGNDFTTLEGWYAYHDFRQMDWSAWRDLSPSDKEGVLDEYKSLHQSWVAIESDKAGSFGQYELSGHRADHLLLNLRPGLDDLIALKTQIQKCELARFWRSTYSYTSVIELSNYVVNREAAVQELDERTKARLYPILPKTHVCFYPMNKRKEGENNWYRLDFDDRRRLMHEHGMSGRKYAGKVSQMIAGSMGFDDWEWCVTLFAEDPLWFKKIVYDMRFDEVSARFGEFGVFYAGKFISIDQFWDTLIR